MTSEVCPSCGYGVPTSDGYCINCVAPEDDPDWENDDGELECTHCGGDGTCDEGSDPLGNCPEDVHRCHACGGSGNRKDQTIF